MAEPYDMSKKSVTRNSDSVDTEEGTMTYCIKQKTPETYNFNSLKELGQRKKEISDRNHKKTVETVCV